MAKLYNSDYREINIRYFFKSIAQSKKIILTITLLTTLISAYWGSLIIPVYNSEGLLKVGYYHQLSQSGDVSRVYLDTGKDLTIELEFLFLGKGNAQEGSIIKVFLEENVQNYIEIQSEGITAEASSNAIKALMRYVQDAHLKFLSNNRKQLELELKNIVRKVDAIIIKQRSILLKEDSYKSGDIESLSNTMQLMSKIEADLAVGYIGKLLERKEKIEELLSDRFEENTALVGEIYSSDSPVTPKQSLIIFIGFLLGIFLSILVVFLLVYSSEEHKE
jgi:hypothetical protein